MVKKIKLDVAEIQNACKTCIAGSCCYEGVELSEHELKRIIKYDPCVAKPWFRLVKNDGEPEEGYPFTTMTHSGTCIFHDKNNRCLIYKVRPQYCRDFPIKEGKKAPYCERLCALFRDQWPNNIIKRTHRLREKK